jgi:hypothetical protein
MVEEFLISAQISILCRLSHNAGHRLVTVPVNALVKFFLLVNRFVEIV